MVDYVWNASTGGDWTVATNWKPDGVPSPLDTAHFATGGNAYTVTGEGSTGALTVDTDQVTFDGAIMVRSGGFAAVNDALVVLGGSADFTVSSLAFDTGTLLQVAGRLIDGAGGSADVVVDSGLDAHLTTASSLTLNQLYVNQGATYAGNVILNDGGSVTLDTSASFGGGSLSLLGNGTLYVADAVGQSTGSLSLSEAVAVSTSLTLASDPGVVLDMSGLISGAGYLVVDGGAVSLAGTNTFSGPTVVIDAALTLTGARSASTGPVFLDNASLVLRADSLGGVVHNEVVVGSGGADTVTAAAGDSYIYAGASAAFTYHGGTGSNVVFGSAAVMSATGGSGHDIIFAGSSGHDTLIGGAGSTTLAAGAGGMLFAVGGAADELVAGGGNTTLSGAASSGNDVYFSGGSGSTLVEAGSGASIVVLSGKLNVVEASAGSQTVFLKDGFTRLDFTEGSNSGGTMAVVGFGVADFLHLAGYGADEMQNALATATVSGGNTVLHLSDNEHIVLFGVVGLSTSSFV